MNELEIIKDVNERTMSIKDIAKLAGKSEQTVRLWLKSASQGLKFQASNAKKEPIYLESLPQIIIGLHQIIIGLKSKVLLAEEKNTAQSFSIDEVIVILQSGNCETLARLLIDNYNMSIAPEQKLKNTIIAFAEDYYKFKNETQKYLSQITQAQYETTKYIHSAEQQKVIERCLKIREKINSFIGEYVILTHVEHYEAWKLLYSRFYDFTGMRFQKEVDGTIISAIEKYDIENQTTYMETLLMIASKSFGDIEVKRLAEENKKLVNKIIDLQNENENLKNYYITPRERTCTRNISGAVN